MGLKSEYGTFDYKMWSIWGDMSAVVHLDPEDHEACCAKVSSSFGTATRDKASRAQALELKVLNGFCKVSTCRKVLPGFKVALRP